MIARGSGEQLVDNSDDLTRQIASAGRQNLGRLTALQSASDQFRVEIHKKYAIAFACIVFVLMGAPLGIRFPRGGIGMVIVASATIFAVYWAGLIGGENLANEGVVPPFWAMWTADLIFLGLGVAPGTPSWGQDISGRNRSFMFDAPWVVLAPGMAISMTVLGFNLFGDALRDILDPRLRGT